MKRLNLAGKKIHSLTVLGYSHSHIQPSGQKRAIWDVICDCGNKKKMSTSTLIHGSTVSCGCIGRVNRIKSRQRPHGLANLNYKYLSYRARARKSGITFSLSQQDFKEIIDKNCNYCGSEPSMPHTTRSYNGLYISNGIDRIDSSGGYVCGNMVACCKLCNIMKNKLTAEEFIDHIKKIGEFYAKKRIVT